MDEICENCGKRFSPQTIEKTARMCRCETTYCSEFCQTSHAMEHKLTQVCRLPPPKEAWDAFNRAFGISAIPNYKGIPILPLPGPMIPPVPKTFIDIESDLGKDIAKEIGLKKDGSIKYILQYRDAIRVLLYQCTEAQIGSILKSIQEDCVKITEDDKKQKQIRRNKK